MKQNKRNFGPSPLRKLYGMWEALRRRGAKLSAACYPTDDEVADCIKSVPPHFTSAAFGNAQSSSGTCTLTMPAASTVTWNLSSLSVSMAGPTSGVNAKLTIWDGPVGTGNVLYAVFLNGPGAVGTGIGSVGTIQEIPLPKTPKGNQSVQATPGNAMNIQVTGTGQNAVSINGRFSDGLPIE